MKYFCKPLYNSGISGKSDEALCRKPSVMSEVDTVALSFRQTRLEDIPLLRPLLGQTPFRTCDFTVGGLFMWVDYFRYSHCIFEDTLFVRGMSENDMSVPAFSLPVGQLPLARSIEILKEYCEAAGIPLILSAVPEDAVEPLMALGAASVEELTDWADYLYEAAQMAAFAGKKMSKKRNRVNHFKAENPDYRIEPLSEANLDQVKDFFDHQGLAADKSLSADYERLQVMDVLRHMDRYGFEGEMLSLPDRGVVAFTMGEVVGDTVYVHIEKMDHEVAGAGETISSHFVGTIMNKYPEVRYVNREEDTGDEGLRRAKQAYHPTSLLKKYNVRF